MTRIFMVLALLLAACQPQRSPPALAQTVWNGPHPLSPPNIRAYGTGAIVDAFSTRPSCRNRERVHRSHEE
jgi:hypothetical protein